MPETEEVHEVDQLWEQASAYREKGQLPEAIEVYDQIIRLEPEHAAAYVERGLLVLEMGDPRQAERDFDRALKLDPEYGPAYYGRGSVKHLKKDFEGEMQDARHGLLLDRRNAGIYYRRIAAAYHSLGQYQEAIKAYNQAIKWHGGHDEETLYNRGLCHMELEEYSEALADFGRSLELAPEWGQAYRARGNTFLMLGESGKAIEDCDEAIRLQPDLLVSYLTRGLAYKARGQMEEARRDFEYVSKTSKDRKMRARAHDLIMRLES
jgi:tetratricopeptide (TPR) repeat protein